MIVVDNLVYEYPGNRALNGVSFTVEKNSITVLVGPNGAGKTTLIRTMTGLYTPYWGQVLLNGKPVHDNPLKAHRNMGYLPDFFGLYDALSVRKCLTYAALTQGSHPDEVGKMVEYAAQRLGIFDRIDQLSGDLSRGLRQRLAIAQAIIHNPEFLVLDEPASGLDPDARIDLSGLFRQLRDEGMTLLVSSHILAELEDYATDMLVLRDGRLVGSKRKIGEEGSQTSRRITMRLAEPHAGIAGLLETFKGVSSIEPDEHGRTVGFSLLGDLKNQSDILQKLVANNVHVAEFREGSVRLRDAYVQSIGDTPTGPEQA